MKATSFDASCLVDDSRFAFSAGSIDGHIQVTKPCDRLVNQAAHIVPVAHIGAQRLGFGAQLAKFSN